MPPDLLQSILQSIQATWESLQSLCRKMCGERPISVVLTAVVISLFLCSGLSKSILDEFHNSDGESPAVQKTQGAPILDVNISPTSTVIPKPAISLKQHGYYTSPSDTLIVIGEVENTGNVDLDQAEVIVLLYEDDRFIGSDNGYIFGHGVRVGERALFRAFFSDPPQNWTHYELQVQAEPISEYARKYFYDDFVIEEIEIILRNNRWVAYGVVKNDGRQTMKLVEIVVGLYDDDGKLLGIIDDYIDLDKLGPGDTSTFTTDIPADYLVHGESDIGKVATWKTEIHGYPDE